MALPRDAVVPDYGDGGLYGLVASFRAYLQGRAWTPPSNGAARNEDANRSLVFLLVDGLGDTFLQRFGTGSTLLAHRTGHLTSVFPSTTASAVTTTLTGLAPAAHGLTGWFVHDRRFGGVLAPLPMLVRGNGPVEGLFPLQRLFPYQTLFQHRGRPASLIYPHYLAGSPFSRRHSRGARVAPYTGLDSMVDAIVRELQSFGTQSGYVHAYYPVFDALSHTHGCESSQVIARFQRIDASFSRLLERLQGCNCDIVVSADHGFIDSPPQQQVRLEDYPDAKRLLNTPLFGERRAAFFGLRPGAERDFKAFSDEVLHGKAVLSSSESLRQSGLLGPGKPHRKLAERTGTHVLLMEPGWTILDRLPDETEHAMLGVHGGLSPQEMWIPLICARC
ncbi:MAG TPA: alkaline phosphatase family protein [Aromatoleum sp.]|uniref:alkaline phosphatase family protein n=1 Tax=Aromatoleum sp. TaxID=2307007 RepID=UPI002B4A5180|nr:alkaline phosphatase family protein [Aromatoleum sp.]HJV26403.1 alkaline phosphatase family protein [Aromatoleum sp.]